MLSPAFFVQQVKNYVLLLLKILIEFLFFTANKAPKIFLLRIEQSESGKIDPSTKFASKICDKSKGDYCEGIAS